MLDLGLRRLGDRTQRIISTDSGDLVETVVHEPGSGGEEFEG